MRQWLKLAVAVAVTAMAVFAGGAARAGEATAFPRGDAGDGAAAPKLEEGWRAFLEKGDLAGAEKLFLEAEKIAKNDQLVQLSLAATEMEKGQYPEAFSRELTVLSVPGWNAWAEMSLADALELMRYAKNAGELVRVLEARVRLPNLGWCEKSLLERALAEARLRTGDVKGAVSEVKEQPYVKEWLALGPFNNRERAGFQEKHEFESDLAGAGGERKFAGRGREVSWITLKSAWNGKLDLNQALYPGQESVAFLTVYVESNADRDASLVLGTGGASSVWFNNRNLYTEDKYHRFFPQQRVLPVKLRRGYNQVVLKLAGDRGGECAAALRVLGAKPEELEQPGSAAVVERLRETIKYSVAPEAAAAYRDQTLPALKAEAGAKPGDGETGLDWGGMAFFRKEAEQSGNALALTSEAFLYMVYGLDDSQWRRCRPLLEKAAKAAPECPLMLEMAALVQQDENEARALLQKAAAEPDAVAARELLLEKLRQGGFLREAERDAHTLLALRQSAVAWNVLAEVEKARGWREEARLDYGKLLELAPGWSDKYASLAALEQGEEGTLAALRRGMETAPDENLKAALGAKLRERQEFAEAERLRRELLTANPFDPEGWKALSDVLRAKGDFGGAVDALREGQEWMPQSPELLEWLGRLRLEKGERSVAIKLLRLSLEYKGDNPDVENYLKQLEPRAEKFYAAREIPFADLKGKDAEQTQYPRHSMVVLLDQCFVKVNGNGTSSTMVHSVRKVLGRPAVREASSHQIGYQKNRQKVEIVTARVTQPDGTVIDNPQIQDSNESGGSGGGGMYGSGYGVKYVMLPQVREGSIVDLQYTIEDTGENTYIDKFEDSFFVGGINPTLRFEYAVDAPADMALNHKVSILNLAPEESASTEAGRKLLLWKAENLPGIEIEPLMPPIVELLPHLRVSSFKDWDEVAQFVYNLGKDQVELPKDITDKTAELVKDCKTRDEKIAAIYYFIIDQIHYVSISYGRHGYKPHKVERTYRSRYGDCKDTALLFVAMLKEAGVDARFTLVRTYNLGNEPTGIPGLGVFNHAIAYVPPEREGSKAYWLDGTTDYFHFGQIPSMDRDTLALTVTEKGAERLVINPDSAALNTSTREIAVALAPGGGGALTLKETMTGEFAPGIKHALEKPKQIRQMLEMMAQGRFAGGKLTRFSHSGTAIADTSSWIAFGIKSGSLAQKQGDDLAYKPVAMPFSLSNGYAAQAERKHDLMLGLTFTRGRKISVSLPEGAKVKSLPGNVNLKHDFASYSRMAKETGGKVEIEMRLTIDTRRITLAQYPAWKEFCNKVDAAEEEMIVYTDGAKAPAELAEMEKDIPDAEDDAQAGNKEGGEGEEENGEPGEE